MGRLFNDAAFEYLEINVAVVTAPPFTLAVWGRSNDATVNQCLLFVGDKDVVNHRFELVMAGGIAGDPIVFSRQGGGGTNNVLTTTGFTTGTWHHCCAVAVANNDAHVYIDGGSEGTSTTSVTVSGADRTSVGRAGASEKTRYMSGDIAEVAIWNVALTDAEVSILANRMSPLLMRPGSLVAYWPIIGGSPEADYAAGSANNLTVTGTVISDHVHIQKPWSWGAVWGGIIGAGVAPVGWEQLLSHRRNRLVRL
jgi:hypothetical protein